MRWLLGGQVGREGLALFLTRMPVTKCVQSVIQLRAYDLGTSIDIHNASIKKKKQCSQTLLCIIINWGDLKNLMPRSYPRLITSVCGGGIQPSVFLKPPDDSNMLPSLRASVPYYFALEDIIHCLPLVSFNSFGISLFPVTVL